MLNVAVWDIYTKVQGCICCVCGKGTHVRLATPTKFTESSLHIRYHST